MGTLPFPWGLWLPGHDQIHDTFRSASLPHPLLGLTFRAYTFCSAPVLHRLVMS